MKYLAAAFALLSSALAPAVGGEYLWPSAVLSLPPAAASTGAVVSVRGVVTFVSGLESNRFVIASEDHPNQRGIEVFLKKDCEELVHGAVVLLSGTLAERNGAYSIDADSIDILRVEHLPIPSVAKQADYRRGLLEGRVVTLRGTVREVVPAAIEGVEVSHVLLLMDGYTALVRLPWTVDGDRLLGEPIEVTGLVRGVFSDGKRIDSAPAVENADGIVMLRAKSAMRVLVYMFIALGAVLVCVTAVLLLLWMRVLRERREASVVAAERSRMAADLHDTIEQHLAGANLLAASVMQLKETPENVRDAMKSMMSLLANAKMEVRSAVLNLRTVGGETQTLAAAVAGLAAALARTGVRTHYHLRGLPESMPEGERQDIILIISEATTNAVKHGHAKTIVFTCDPRADGFVLRVLNDGEPFEIDSALGPETGHYGLSGMRERALRNRIALSWGVRGRWSYVQLESEGQNG